MVGLPLFFLVAECNFLEVNSTISKMWQLGLFSTYMVVCQKTYHTYRLHIGTSTGCPLSFFYHLSFHVVDLSYRFGPSKKDLTAVAMRPSMSWRRGDPFCRRLQCPEFMPTMCQHWCQNLWPDGCRDANSSLWSDGPQWLQSQREPIYINMDIDH